MTPYKSEYQPQYQREEMPYPPIDPRPSGLLFEDDWEEQQNSKKWQILPPMVTGGRIAAVKVNKDTAPTPISPYPVQANREGEQTIQRSAPQPSQRQDPLAFCRVSFVGQDQQWYSINIAKSMLAQPQTAQPLMQAQPQPYLQAAPPMAQAAPMMQAAPELNPAWRDLAPDDMWGRAYAPMSERPEPSAVPYQKQEEGTSKDFLLQIVQPGLAGLMDGSVSTLAPIFAVAFATHQPFTTFLVGMASALGAGISMTFSEALSDDGDITGRGKPFVRGGVTGLMTFISGAGHALPFLVPNIQLALILAYAVVAVELLVIAAIRHKFFGTGWWLSIVQVVGGGALVFITAILLGNA
jgi:erythrin-vacuolar iron transport family protein